MAGKITAEVETQRLILRRWRPEDLGPFAELNADPVVMEFFLKRLTAGESDAFAKTIEARFDQNGFCFWAAELKSTRAFIGYIGLNIPTLKAPFMPCVEIAWRLASRYWGQGLAPEGARAEMAYGFEQLRLEKIVAFASTTNIRSLRVMEKIGMTYDPAGDFEHPNFPPGHPLRPHVLYRISPKRQET